MAIPDMDPSDAKLIAQARAAAAAKAAADKAAADAAALAQSNAARNALTKLTGGQTLTAEDKALLNIGPAVTATTSATTTGATTTGATTTGATTTGATTTTVVTEKPFQFTDPDTGVTVSFATAAELSAYAVSWATKKVTSTTAQKAADAKALEDKNRKTAQQEFRAALNELGLGDLADTVDKMILDDKTVSQIKLDLPGTEAYKLRFPGMKALRDAGQAISEATYIANERAMIQTANAYGVDKALVSRELMGKYIGKQIAPAEFERRVEMAADRVDKRTDVVTAMTTFFPGSDKGGMITYLLNPEIGMDVLKKQVRTAEIGAAASAAGFGIGAGKTITQARAESLIDATGTKDLATLKAEFGQAGILGRTQARLAGIEQKQYDTFEAAQAVIGSDAAAIMESKKRAERESKFRFGGQSGVSSTSLIDTKMY